MVESLRPSSQHLGKPAKSYHGPMIVTFRSYASLIQDVPGMLP